MMALLRYSVIALLSCWLVNFPNLAAAQSISSTELINNAKEYDGKVVVYAGEVIGDIMRRGGYAWVNLHDGKTAIGVWLASPLIKDIVYTGNYRSKGDWVEVSGILHRACREHGGDLDIHALELRKTRDGRPVMERLNPAKRNLIAVLAGVLCLVLILR